MTNPPSNLPDFGAGSPNQPSLPSGGSPNSPSLPSTGSPNSPSLPAGGSPNVPSSPGSALPENEQILDAAAAGGDQLGAAVGLPGLGSMLANVARQALGAEWQRSSLIRLVGDAIQPDDFTLLELRGRDAIGECFRFDLVLESERDDWDLGELLRAPCRLEFGQGVELPIGGQGLSMLPIHGVLCQIEQRHRDDRRYVYQATLVPTLWRLSLSRRCRTFLDLSVPDILREVFADGGLPDDEVEFRLEASYPALPVVNQYQESDLDFAARLMEHEGIAFFWEHGSERSTLVLCDSAEGFPQVPADGELPYRPDQAAWNQGELFAGSWFAEAELRRITCSQQPLPERVVLQDYQHERPSLDLRSEAEVAADAAFGVRYEYGGNYPDPDAGRNYARIRSEELACRQRIFRGLCSSRAMRAGAIVGVRDHFRDSFNRELLLTAVEHRASGTLDTMAYSCSFEAIPADVPFRPARRTPKPQIGGVVPAKVDAAGDGTYAEVDADGSYRIKFGFDLSDRSDGSASPPIRMGQPYGGAGMGLHYPLHKGVEVAVGFIHGDPDRPFISQSLPNPETPSEVTEQNTTECVLRSGGGNSIVFDDTGGSERFDVNATRDRTLTVGNDNTETVSANETLTVSGNRTVTVKKAQRHTVEGDDSTTIRKNQSLTLSGGNRTVTITGDETIELTGSQTVKLGGAHSLSVTTGQQEIIDGGRTVSVTGGSTETISGGETRNIDGGSTRNITGTDGTTIAGDLIITASDGGLIETGPRLTISATSITLEARGSLTLSCSGNTIMMGPTGISISGSNVTINGSSMVDITGAMVRSNATG